MRYRNLMDIETLELLLPGLEAVLPGSFIRKVHQMTAWHLLLKLGGATGAHNLLLSLAPEEPGLHLTGGRFANPPRPLRFCAFLRHHFQGARISRVEQVPGDRVIIIRAARAAGDPLALAAEFTGRRGNLVFTRGTAMTVEELLFPRQPAAGDRLRQGTAYHPPPAAGRRREKPPPPWLDAAREQLAAGNLLAPHRLYDRWFLPRYEEKYGLVTSRELRHRLKKMRRQLQRRLAKLEREAAEKEKHLEQEPNGELLKSVLHRLRRGDRQVTVTNYWSPNLEEITIPLDPALGPRENLEKLYQRVRKAKRGLGMIAARLAATRAELAYLEDLAYQVEECREPAVLEEYAALLGLKPREHGRRPAGGAAAEEKTKADTAPASVARETLPGGAVVYIGKSAVGNENIYRHLSGGDDLWFHAKDTPGAHVLLKTPNSRPATEGEIEAAARLAAANSRARSDTRVEVMYLPRKYIKKPRGGKPGQVLIQGPQQTFTVRLPRP